MNWEGKGDTDEVAGIRVVAVGRLILSCSS